MPKDRGYDYSDFAIAPGERMAGEWQFVEGFSAIIEAPYGPTWSTPPFEPGDDFRGHSAGWWTNTPWFRPAGEPRRLKWETAPVQRAMPTVLAFSAAVSNLPLNQSGSIKARLFVNGAPALTFELGGRVPWRWSSGDYALTWRAKRAQFASDGYNRQTEMHGTSGTFELEVPARDIAPGQAVELAVEVAADPRNPRAFFMLKDRSDTLRQDVVTNAEQIEALQRDLIQTQRALNALARGVYPQYLPQRLESRETVVHTAGETHANGPDLSRSLDGRLDLVWRAASEHISADGRILYMQSDDQGSTWSQPHQIGGHPWPVDSRDPVTHHLPNGDMFVTWWSRHAHSQRGERMPLETGVRLHDTYAVWSRDGGATWEDPVTIDPGPFAWTAVESPLVVLPNGRLLLPSSQCNHPEPWAFVHRSDDGGKTWQFHARIGDHPPPAGYPETTLARLPSGRLVAMVRVNDGNHLQSESDDDGDTWTPWHETPLASFGHRARLTALSTGELLCSHGRRLRRRPGHDDATSIRVAVSFDEGRTWDVDQNLKVIRDDLLDWDMGYPTTVELSDGEFLTAYWHSHFERYFISLNRWRKWW